MSQSVIQSSFTGGEITDALDARTDLAQYASALATMRNFFPHVHGSASNRPGSIFINEVKYSAKKTRIVTFQFSVTQLYFIEFGDQYLRFYMNGGVILNAGVPYEISTPFLEADLFKLKFKQSADKLYIRHPSYPRYELTRTGHTAWTLTAPTTGASISTPGAITRSSGAGSGHYYVVTAFSATGEETPASPQTGSFGPADVLTWTAVSGASYYYVYETLNQATNGSYGYITRANTNTITIPASSVTPDSTKGVPIARSLFAATNDYPGVCAFFDQRLYEARTNNNPQTIFGSVVGNSFNNFNISAPIKSDDAVTFTLNSEQVNEIRWMAVLDSLVIGTAGGEWRAKHGTNSDAITPASIDLKQQSSWGCDDLRPLVIGRAILFLEASRSKVRSLIPSNSLIDGFDSSDISILAQHLLENYGIKDWAYAQAPESIIWGVRDDGLRLGITFHQEHKINAWHHHDTDGLYESLASAYAGSGSQDVYTVVNRTINGVQKRYIERDAPRNFPDVRTAWFVDCGLQRDTPLAITGITKANPAVVTSSSHGLSNGDTVILNDVVGMTNVNQFYYKAAGVTTNTFTLQTLAGAAVDSSSYGTYVSGGTIRKCSTTFTGLSHLEGKMVVALADGNYVPNLSVASGSVTLPFAAGLVTVGLPYTCDLQTLDLDFQNQSGPLQDKIRSVKSVLLDFKRTRSCYVGQDALTLQEVKFRTVEPNGTPIALYTGEKEVFLYPADDNIRNSRVFIRVTEALPITVKAIMARIDVGQK